MLAARVAASGATLEEDVRALGDPVDLPSTMDQVHCHLVPVYPSPNPSSDQVLLGEA